MQRMPTPAPVKAPNVGTLSLLRKAPNRYAASWPSGFLSIISHDLQPRHQILSGLK